MKPKKALIIGLGSMGKRYAWMLKNRNIETWALRSFPSGVESKAVDHELTDWSQISEAKMEFDYLFITNPTSMHIETALESIGNMPGVQPHMLIEKPIGIGDYGEDVLLRELIRKSVRRRFHIYIAYNLRFNQEIIQTKKNIAQGNLDKACVHHAVCRCNSADWPSERELDDVIFELSHEFDYLTHFFGAIKSYIPIVKTNRIAVTDIIHETGYHSRVTLDMDSPFNERYFMMRERDGSSYFINIAPADTYERQLEYFISATRIHKPMENEISDAIHLYRVLTEMI